MLRSVKNPHIHSQTSVQGGGTHVHKVSLMELVWTKDLCLVVTVHYHTSTLVRQT